MSTRTNLAKSKSPKELKTKAKIGRIDKILLATANPNAEILMCHLLGIDSTVKKEEPHAKTSTQNSRRKMSNAIAKASQPLLNMAITGRLIYPLSCRKLYTQVQNPSLVLHSQRRKKSKVKICDFSGEQRLHSRISKQIGTRTLTTQWLKKSYKKQHVRNGGKNHGVLNKAPKVIKAIN